MHQRIAAEAFPPRPGALLPGGPGISRFPCGWCPRVRGVSDRAGPARPSPRRCAPCGLPLFSTASAPWTFNLSRLNTQPAVSPVNASPPSSRISPHDSGPSWAATPSTCDSCIRFHPPVSRRAVSVGSRFLPLLQSAFIEPFSVPVPAALRRRFGRGSRVDLDIALVEPERKSLSGGRLLPVAWDLADPVYKVHPIVFTPGRSTVRRRWSAVRALAGGHHGRESGR